MTWLRLRLGFRERIGSDAYSILNRTRRKMIQDIRGVFCSMDRRNAEEQLLYLLELLRRHRLPLGWIGVRNRPIGESIESRAQIGLK